MAEYTVSDAGVAIGEQAAATVSILQRILGAATGTAASMDFVCDWLKRTYVENDCEKRRKCEAAIRDAFYENQGDDRIEAMIDIAFASEKNKKLRRDLIPWAKYNNVIGRIVREKATVYRAPAKRRIGAGDQRYQEFLELVMHDQAMRELDRKLALHEDAWIQYRVRVTATGEREPVLDVVSPAMFWAIAHPRDATLLIGIILDQTPADPAAKGTDPHYRVWTDTDTFMLDRACRLVPGTLEAWPLGRMPGVLATTRLPSTKGQLLAPCASGDLTAAHQAVWFLNVLGLKESKSASKQAVHTGDTSSAIPGQDNDTETDLIMPEGVQSSTLDRGMDLAQFRDMASSVADDVGVNHGVPPTMRKLADATSGVELDLRRIPLRELRTERIPFLRLTERRMMQIEAGVNGRDLEEYAFSPDGWSMDFAEIQEPLSEAERDAIFEKRRELGLTDTIDEIMQRNPDLTPDQAMELLALHVRRETERVRLMKDLMRLNGSTSSAPGEATPQQNGAQGRAAADGKTGGGKTGGDSGAPPAIAAA